MQNKTSITTFQGHRGARGLAPENTIPSFKKALEYGLQGLEIDIVLTAENQFLVSHDPFFSHEFCSKPNGEAISKKEELQRLIYKMDYETIKKYDCGKRGHLRYPEQKPFPATKPLLKSFFEEIEKYVLNNKIKKPFYTLEIKSELAWYGFMQPLPSEMVALFIKEITAYPFFDTIKDRLLIESFDVNILNELYKQTQHTDTKFEIGFLVENKLSIEENLAKLNFMPSVYVPYYRLLTKKKIEELHQKGLKVFTWTVNNTEVMQKLKNWGVDSIITDFPNRIPVFESILK
ncbi:glycerophosphoryl diester phosphodiesterase [Bernardetia litoralis DSM 6794]|uniref:Glycerophosphoryl diester phosphodiesterase n=1 Tax=Bernardetia litoralis (strain ATCC 23117 / DSM 6794 / NBRC 15988 / NCIMB 1366 / Fx l1 / Sio-4) TaxID=880071 RepID=I4APN3_BERLS|nr:glycerophosphodiester phosphodiesterase family protein [Bernardetia litoralis]AFM05918.1 glycerophosphoryl diester phosphodiesterase [Bernardetia litoralis DSM 6794]